MDLHLLVCLRASRCHLFGLGSINRSLQLGVAQLVQDLEAVTQGSQGGGIVAGVLVCEGASLSDVLLEEEITGAVAGGYGHPLGIVGEVDDAILDSFEVTSF